MPGSFDDFSSQQAGSGSGTSHSELSPPPPPRLMTFFYNPGTVRNAMEYTKNGEGKGRAWRNLAALVDKFGARFTGTLALEHAIGTCQRSRVMIKGKGHRFKVHANVELRYRSRYSNGHITKFLDVGKMDEITPFSL